MRMDKLPNKFQLALADAQSLAVGRDHQFIEPLHVLQLVIRSITLNVRMATIDYVMEYHILTHLHTLVAMGLRCLRQRWKNLNSTFRLRMNDFPFRQQPTRLRRSSTAAVVG